MDHDHITIIVAVVGIAGTLGGVVAGHFLTRSWQRKQWLQDRRKEEFRELMTTLVDCFGNYGHARYLFQSDTKENILQRAEVSARCYQTLCDRIYIAKDVERLNLVRRWADAVEGFVETNDVAKFGDALRCMTEELVKAATGDL